MKLRPTSTRVKPGAATGEQPALVSVGSGSARLLARVLRQHRDGCAPDDLLDQRLVRRHCPDGHRGGAERRWVGQRSTRTGRYEQGSTHRPRLPVPQQHRQAPAPVATTKEAPTNAGFLSHSNIDAGTSPLAGRHPSRVENFAGPCPHHVVAPMTTPPSRRSRNRPVPTSGRRRERPAKLSGRPRCTRAPGHQGTEHRAPSD